MHSIYFYVHHSEIDSQITHVTEIHCSYTLINAVKICTFVFLLLLYIVQCTKTVYIVYCCFYIVHILNVPERLRHDDVMEKRAYVYKEKNIFTCIHVYTSSL